MAKLFKSIVCPICGQEHQDAKIEDGATVRCARCDSVIFQDTRKSVSRVLAFSVGALMLYVPANIYPILSIKRLGVYSESTIWQGVRELFANGYWGVATLVFLASIVVPLLKLMVMIYLAGASHRGGRERMKLSLFRLIEAIGPWSMLDVFLAAILVGLVKLGDLATIKPEPGLVAFAAVVVLTLLASASFEPRDLWKKGTGAMSNEPNIDSQNKKIQTDHELPKVKVVRKKMLSWAWVAPLFAVLLAAFLVYRSLPATGVQIIIRTSDGSGIEANSTLIRYRGVRIGIVSDVTLDKDLDHVLIKARLDKFAGHVARVKTQFWIVRPDISFSSVKGLETIISGPYITLQPGSGEPKFEFEALPSAPVAEESNAGLRIQLKAKRLGALKMGSSVLYRDVSIGEVYDYQLAENSTFVKLFLYIKEPYKRLVRENSVFWDASGFDVSVSLLGMKISAESFKGFFTGAVGMATPDTPGALVKDGETFELQEKQEGDWAKWAPKIEIHTDNGGKVSKRKAPQKEEETIKKPIQN